MFRIPSRRSLRYGLAVCASMALFVLVRCSDDDPKPVAPGSPAPAGQRIHPETTTGIYDGAKPKTGHGWNIRTNTKI
jgi:hypothetical protein